MTDQKPAGDVTLTEDERERVLLCGECDQGVHAHNDLGRTINKAICARAVPEARIAAMERIVAERVRVLTEALSDAIDELVECRSFISIETRHYPTVAAIGEKVAELRAVLAPAEQGGEGRG